MADIQPGTTVSIAADIVVSGAVAFGRGEQVTVQQVSPLADRPEYKYTVYSQRSGSWFTLRDADFVAAYAPPAPAVPAYAAQQQPPYLPAPQPQKSNTALKGCLLAFGIVVLIGIILVVVLVAVVGVGVHHAVNDLEKNGTTKLPGGVTLSTKTPTEAELGVPIYPGSKAVSSSVSLKDPSGNVSATVLYSNDPPAKVVAWYKDKLSSKPEFQVLTSTDEEALMTFKEADGSVKMVTIGRDTIDKNGQTTIAIGSSQDKSVPGTPPASN
ncbi:MAG TPA: hypothetical protein VIK02_01345 [Candidatus Anoxymicrobiaceae bacterium]